MQNYHHEPEGYHCPFCHIISGDFNNILTQASDVVYQDAYTTAFIGARWWVNNPGHVIVIPNTHVENIYDLDGEQAAQIHETARTIALALKQVYGCGGISTRQHNEPDGYQDVWHYHLHVFPRYAGDRLYGSDYWMPSVENRLPYADRLRQYLLLNKG
ncbi:MAG TPA: HIT family protein [Phototrophicaceae bacterium]|nr:HIT family protein [Phototrophicaceae bacterium]